MSNFRRPSPPVSDVFIPKWNREVLVEGFVPFPRRLMRCLDKVIPGENVEEVLGKLQVILAIADAKRLSKDGVPVRPPTLEFLAYNAGMETRAFELLVQKLQWNGLISVMDSNPKNFDVDLALLLLKIEKATPKGS